MRSFVISQSRILIGETRLFQVYCQDEGQGQGQGRVDVNGIVSVSGVTFRVVHGARDILIVVVRVRVSVGIIIRVRFIAIKRVSVIAIGIVG